jgi:hypothetical protein
MLPRAGLVAGLGITDDVNRRSVVAVVEEIIRQSGPRHLARSARRRPIKMLKGGPRLLARSARRRPIQVLIAAFVVAGGLTTAFVPGSGASSAGNQRFGYGECPPSHGDHDHGDQGRGQGGHHEHDDGDDCD